VFSLCRCPGVKLANLVRLKSSRASRPKGLFTKLFQIMSMPTFAILPVKLNDSKTRLSTIFSAKERKELTIVMLKDVLGALGPHKRLRVVIISSDDVPSALPDQKFDFVYEDERKGLKVAVEKAVGYAIKNGATSTLFVPVDTPLIRSGHVDDVLRLGKKNPLIMSHARRGGVGMIFKRPPGIIGERFTKTSFMDIETEAKMNGVPVFVYDSFSLSLDIDTPEDIREFLLCGRRDLATYEFLKGYESRL